MTKEKYNEIAELNYALAQKSDTNHQLVEQMAELNERCSELEAQIEKMKCCEMCGNHNWQGCVFSSEERLNCINNKRNLFELKEIKEK